MSIGLLEGKNINPLTRKEVLMSLNLYTASHQWASRPDDERYEDLETMEVAGKAFREMSRIRGGYMSDIRVEAKDGDVVMAARENLPQSTLTNYAFKHLCGLISAPSGYLQDIPAELAVQNLNYGFGRVGSAIQNRKLSFFLHEEEEQFTLKGTNAPKFSRIWNDAVISNLIKMRDQGWRIPPARPSPKSVKGIRVATEADVLDNRNFGLSVNVGDMIAPAGLYLSGHDMFAFMINEQNPLDEGNGIMLSRGMMVHNSDVNSKLLVTLFLCRHVCGNHIVWDASQVNEIKIPHLGLADETYYSELLTALETFNNIAASEFQTRITKAKVVEIGKNKDEVLQTLANKNILGVRRAARAYDLTEEHPEDGSPRSVWGMAQGITRLSQELTTFTDERTILDSAAGKVLALAA